MGPGITGELLAPNRPTVTYGDGLTTRNPLPQLIASNTLGQNTQGDTVGTYNAPPPLGFSGQSQPNGAVSSTNNSSVPVNIETDPKKVLLKILDPTTSESAVKQLVNQVAKQILSTGVQPLNINGRLNSTALLSVGSGYSQIRPKGSDLNPQSINGKLLSQGVKMLEIGGPAVIAETLGVDDTTATGIYNRATQNNEKTQFIKSELARLSDMVKQQNELIKDQDDNAKVDDKKLAELGKQPGASAPGGQQ